VLENFTLLKFYSAKLAAEIRLVFAFFNRERDSLLCCCTQEIRILDNISPAWQSLRLFPKIRLSDPRSHLKRLAGFATLSVVLKR
jgi:hypothetical protein